MGHHEQVEQVRMFVRETLVKLGAKDGEEITESMLIRDGFFCGWRFDAGECEAIWFVEEREIKFVNCDGAVIQVTDLSSESHSVEFRRAA